MLNFIIALSVLIIEVSVAGAYFMAPTARDWPRFFLSWIVALSYVAGVVATLVMVIRLGWMIA